MVIDEPTLPRPVFLFEFLALWSPYEVMGGRLVNSCGTGTRSRIRFCGAADVGRIAARSFPDGRSSDRKYRDSSSSLNSFSLPYFFLSFFLFFLEITVSVSASTKNRSTKQKTWSSVGPPLPSSSYFSSPLPLFSFSSSSSSSSSFFPLLRHGGTPTERRSLDSVWRQTGRSKTPSWKQIFARLDRFFPSKSPSLFPLPCQNSTFGFSFGNPTTRRDSS